MSNSEEAHSLPLLAVFPGQRASFRQICRARQPVFRVLGGGKPQKSSAFQGFASLQRPSLKPSDARCSTGLAQLVNDVDEDVLDVAPAIKRQRDTAFDRKQTQESWESMRSSLVFLDICSAAELPVRQQTFQQRLKDEFVARVQRRTQNCTSCNAVQSLQPCGAASNTILLCSLGGSVSVPFPVLSCEECNAQMRVHPLDVDCFPSSPISPSVWYDQQLIQFAHQLQIAGALALGKLVQAILGLHSTNGCTTPKSAFKGLAAALLQWAAMKAAVQQEISEGMQTLSKVRQHVVPHHSLAVSFIAHDWVFLCTCVFPRTPLLQCRQTCSAPAAIVNAKRYQLMHA